MIVVPLRIDKPSLLKSIYHYQSFHRSATRVATSRKTCPDATTDKSAFTQVTTEKLEVDKKRPGAEGAVDRPFVIKLQPFFHLVNFLFTLIIYYYIISALTFCCQRAPEKILGLFRARVYTQASTQ